MCYDCHTARVSVGHQKMDPTRSYPILYYKSIVGHIFWAIEYIILCLKRNWTCLSLSVVLSTGRRRRTWRGEASWSIRRGFAAFCKAKGCFHSCGISAGLFLPLSFSFLFGWTIWFFISLKCRLGLVVSPPRTPTPPSTNPKKVSLDACVFVFGLQPEKITYQVANRNCLLTYTPIWLPNLYC
jgi:hypothetical protein